MPANPATLRAEQGYRAALLIRARQAVIAATSRLATVDPENLGASFLAILPSLVALITLGQRDAQILATAYLRTVSELELGEPLDLQPINPAIAGSTFDGRAVEAGLRAFIPATFLALKRGLVINSALNIARYGVSRFVHTEVTDAAMRETAAQGAANPEVSSGWTWVTGGAKPCGACLANQNGRVHPWSRPMGRHAGCSCIESPVFPDVPDTAPRPTGMDIFTSMTAAQQVGTFRTAGEAKAALVNSGRITLDDLVDVQESHQWRDQIVEKPLDALGISDEELASILKTDGTTPTT